MPRICNFGTLLRGECPLRKIYSQKRDTATHRLGELRSKSERFEKGTNFLFHSRNQTPLSRSYNTQANSHSGRDIATSKMHYVKKKLIGQPMLNGHLFETKIFVLFCFPLQTSFTVESTAK